MLSLIDASTYVSGLRHFEHLYLCAGWHVCFPGDVEQMVLVTTHTFVSGLRRVERGCLSTYRPSLNYFVSIRQRLSPAGCAAALSPLSHTQRYFDSSAAPEEEFNPLITAVHWSGGL